MSENVIFQLYFTDFLEEPFNGANNLQIKKIFRITTVPQTLSILLKKQLISLKEKGIDLEVVSSFEDSDDGMWEGTTLRRHRVPMERKIRPIRDLISLIKFIILFYREKPYIVHSSTPKSSLLSMVAGFITRVPHRIYNVTGLRFESTKGLLRLLLVFMERISCFCATKVIPEGEGVKSTLRNEKITRKIMSVLANGSLVGVDVDYYSRIVFSNDDLIELKNTLGIADTDFVFCFVGRIVKDKGINELITAFSEVNKLQPKTKLLLVGSFENDLDPITDMAMKEIKSNENIIFTGFMTDIRKHLLITDTFVFPSYREGFPNAVLQAGSMGLPSIVSNINGCNEIIVNNLTGEIIASQNCNALKASMLKFIENKSTLSSMGSEAQNRIVAKYSEQIVTEAVATMYTKLLNG